MFKRTIFTARCYTSAFTNTGAQSCIHGSVRLVGSDSNAGRLEICMNGEWGTVCDDKWGPSESKVVCRQLQYPVDEPGIEQG